MKAITPSKLKELLERDEVMLIDVREPSEHQHESIEQSHLIPLSQFSPEKLPKSQKPMVFYCHSGRRSAEVCRKILQHNPNLQLYGLDGGITGWKQQGFPIKKSCSPALPLERQTQIAAGSLILASMIMGTFITPEWYALAGFVGAGLTFAGLTGWCGMALLLAKMPWNQ